VARTAPTSARPRTVKIQMRVRVSSYLNGEGASTMEIGRTQIA
jgi:hypothetical protein